jgi:hypothetical protein
MDIHEPRFLITYENIMLPVECIVAYFMRKPIFVLLKVFIIRLNLTLLHS